MTDFIFEKEGPFDVVAWEAETTIGSSVCVSLCDEHGFGIVDFKRPLMPQEKFLSKNDAIIVARETGSCSISYMENNMKITSVSLTREAIDVLRDLLSNSGGQ